MSSSKYSASDSRCRSSPIPCLISPNPLFLRVSAYTKTIILPLIGSIDSLCNPPSGHTHTLQPTFDRPTSVHDTSSSIARGSKNFIFNPTLLHFFGIQSFVEQSCSSLDPSSTQNHHGYPYTPPFRTPSRKRTEMSNLVDRHSSNNNVLIRKNGNCIHSLKESR